MGKRISKDKEKNKSKSVLLRPLETRPENKSESKIKSKAKNGSKVKNKEKGADRLKKSAVKTVARLGAAFEKNGHSRLVLNNLQEGVLAVDDQLRVLLVNDALYRLLKVTQGRYLDRPLLEIVRVPRIVKLVTDVLANRSESEETIEVGSHGAVLRVVAQPLSLKGNAHGVLLTVRDETLLHRIESARRDFVTNVSHELRTPLAVIRAYAETLQMGGMQDDEHADRFIGGIIDQVDRLAALVQGMLQLSKLQSGIALKAEPIDACQAVQPCLAALAALAQPKRIDVLTDFPEAIVFHSDLDGFQTIVSNLLSNAAKYTPEGGQISISMSQEDGTLVLHISDTGIGISPQDVERIFERFFRTDAARLSVANGSGLGLSIVKHLTQALGGTISVRSKPKQGSCFEVRLPME